MVVSWPEHSTPPRGVVDGAIRPPRNRVQDRGDLRAAVVAWPNPTQTLPVMSDDAIGLIASRLVYSPHRDLE